MNRPISWEVGKVCVYGCRRSIGKTLGVIGCGNIGSIVADRAVGLKMRVVAFDPFLTPERAVELGVEKADLDELLGARGHHHSCTRRLTDQTRNILNAVTISLNLNLAPMWSIARAAVSSTRAALKDALDAGRVSPAPRLTFMKRSRRPTIPCLATRKVVATPHLGASTREAQENVAIQIAEQMADYLTRGAVSNSLNSPSVTAEEAPRLETVHRAWQKNLASFAGQLIGERC